MFGRIFNSWAERRQEKEAIDFLGRLQSMNSDEMGIPLLATLEAAAMIEAEKGHDMFDPFSVMAADPSILLHLHKVIAELRKLNRQPLVGGPMLWIHTLRSTVNHRVRPLARRMWAEINRGVPHAEDARDQLLSLYMMWPSLDRLGETPKGLEATR